MSTDWEDRRRYLRRKAERRESRICLPLFFFLTNPLFPKGTIFFYAGFLPTTLREKGRLNTSLDFSLVSTILFSFLNVNN